MVLRVSLNVYFSQVANYVSRLLTADTTRSIRLRGDIGDFRPDGQQAMCQIASITRFSSLATSLAIAESS